jgi:hypothetical protein
MQLVCTKKVRSAGLASEPPLRQGSKSTYAVL